MPQAKGRASSPAAPTAAVSRPSENGSKPSSKHNLASRRRSKPESSAPQEPGRTSAVEWVDIEADSARHRRTSKRRVSASSGGQKSRSGNTEGDLGKFLGTRLSRILESVEAGASGRTPSKQSGPRKQSQGGSARRHRHKEDVTTGNRRPVKHRAGSLSKRSEPLLRVNPSLLSLLSSLTGVSDSSSNTTITQRSYYNRESLSSAAAVDRTPEISSSSTKNHESQLNVFDYMETNPTCEDEEDTRSVASESSTESLYEQQSDSGSSDQPGTPSSRSSCPSPTTTRQGGSSGSVSELRRKYDSQFGADAVPVESPKRWSKSVTDAKTKSGRRSHVADEDEGVNIETSINSGAESDSRKSSSSRSSRHEERLRQQREAVQQPHSPAQSQHQLDHVQHPTQADHEQYRSFSGSSVGSASSNGAFPQFMAMQHYQHPAAPMRYNQSAPSGHVAAPDRPAVPEAPDLTQRTLAGYELLALELTNADSSVKPAYRKFEYLNNRILLHLQDELSEMEEQLRTYDEIIAQVESAPDQKRQPASRRGESFGGTEVHHRRTQLLGRIFLKTEQYSRAMTSFAAMKTEFRPAKQDQITSYRAWLAEKGPIHEVETKFLQNEGDLVQLRNCSKADSKVESSSPPNVDAVALSCLPMALMLPILLFSIIPTLSGRLTITLLIAVGAFMVASTTRIRYMLSGNEWAICGGVYVLLMAAIAGCIPLHAG